MKPQFASPIFFTFFTTLLVLHSAAQDVCSVWVPLSPVCGAFFGDVDTINGVCNMHDRVEMEIPNSFDTSTRNTNPSSSFTYCENAKSYAWNVPSAAQNSTTSIVTLVGAIPGVLLIHPNNSAQLYIVLASGVEIKLGAFVAGYNTVIGSQKEVGRPTNIPTRELNYPFNTVMTCRDQTSFQVWRIPSDIASQTITQIRIYDPAQVLKVYSITMDVCDSYASSTYNGTMRYLGDHATNSALVVPTASIADGAATIVNEATSWPQCAGACAAVGTRYCAAYVYSIPTRVCTLARSINVLEPDPSGSTVVGVNPIEDKIYGVLPATPSGISNYSKVMLRRPDLYSNWKQSLFFSYRDESNKLGHAMSIVTGTRYALAYSFNGQHVTTNYLASYFQGGRMSVCGNPTSQPIRMIPFMSNATTGRPSCQWMGYCLPQRLASSISSFTGAFRAVLRDDPTPFVNCSETQQRLLMLLSVETNSASMAYQGGVYGFAHIVASRSDVPSTTAGVQTLLGGLHFTTVANVQILSQFTSIGSAVTSHMILYATELQDSAVAKGLSPLLHTAPHWFWADEERRSYSASLFCELKTSPVYYITRNTLGQVSAQYRCGEFSSLFAALDACNQDDDCVGYTTLASATSELPACLLNNATVGDTDEPDATMFIKSWVADPLSFECSFPTRGGYDVVINYAKGFKNGAVKVIADDVEVGTCTAPATAPTGEASCKTMSPCFVGLLPNTTKTLKLVVVPQWPLGQTCTASLMLATVTFNMKAVTETQPDSCITSYSAAADVCSATSTVAATTYTPPLCGSSDRQLDAFLTPSITCTASSTSTPTILTLNPAHIVSNIYASVDMTGMSTAERRSGAVSVTLRDASGRTHVAGFLTHPPGGRMKLIPAALSPRLSPTTLCLNPLVGDTNPAANVAQFNVPTTFSAGVTSLVFKGAGLKVMGVTTFNTSSGCSPAMSYQSAASDRMFRHIVPGAEALGGSEITRATVEDFAACASLCVDTANCVVYTYYANEMNCVLRVSAGRWAPAPITTAFTVMSGSLSPQTFVRRFSAGPTGNGVHEALSVLATGFSHFILFSGDANRPLRVRLSLSGASSYQLALSQTWLAGDGVVVSGYTSHSAAQSCGNQFTPFLGSDNGQDNAVGSFRVCPVVTSLTTLINPFDIVGRPNTPSAASTLHIHGILGTDAAASLLNPVMFYRALTWAQDAIVSATVPGTVLENRGVITFNSSAHQLVLYNAPASEPKHLSASSTLSTRSYCELVMKVVFSGKNDQGAPSASSYRCNEFTSTYAAEAACRTDSNCKGFTVSKTNGVICLASSTNTILALAVFFTKITASSCKFQLDTPGIVSVSVMQNGLYQGSGNNVLVKFKGRLLQKCGTSRPFRTGYATGSTPQCTTFLECFNELIPGVGELEIVFPEMTTTTCSGVFGAAIVALTPQPPASRYTTAMLPYYRSIKRLTSDLSFAYLQSGATQVSVVIKQDRFFTLGSYAVNVSVGPTAVGLCGGSVGFMEGLGLSDACWTYYYCGQMVGNAPIIYPSLNPTGLLSLNLVTPALTTTTSCGNSFEAQVYTDGMLLTTQSSYSSFRMVYCVLTSAPTTSNTAAMILDDLKTNLATVVASSFPSLNATTATLYMGKLFPIFELVVSTSTQSMAIVDDVRGTAEEAKIAGLGRVACIIDTSTDSDLSDHRCEIVVSANKISIWAAQSNFNDVGETMTILVNDVVIEVCGGDDQFYGFQGLSSLCNSYFNCYTGWITPGSIVQIVFSQALLATSTCSPAAVAYIDVSNEVYVAPVDCSATPSRPFPCHADRVCMPYSQICDDQVQCSDRSDEGRCKNWNFAGSQLAPICAPDQVFHGVGRQDCIRRAVASGNANVFVYNASVCAVYSCVSFSNPQILNSSTVGATTEMWVYTTDPRSFMSCSDSLHCSNNGVVNSAEPPCLCTCNSFFTGSACDQQLDLALIRTVVGVLDTPTRPNSSVLTAFTDILYAMLPTGTVISVASVEQLEDSGGQVGTPQYGVFTYISSFTGAVVENSALVALMTYASQALAAVSVPTLASLTSSSVVGPRASLDCYKTNFGTEGYGCSTTASIGSSRGAAVTISGISFISPSQYVDITLHAPVATRRRRLNAVNETTVTIRCEYSDFSQYRDVGQEGFCSYTSTCNKEIVGMEVGSFEITASPNINPANTPCSGYLFVASASVSGVVFQESEAGMDEDVSTIKVETKREVNFLILTIALCALGLLCVALLISWFRIRRKYEKIKFMGPIFALFGFLFLFAGFIGLAFYIGSATTTHSHLVLIEEYRDELCSESRYAYIPYRVSFAHANMEGCSQLGALGPQEGILFVNFLVPTNQSAGNMTMYRGSETGCKAAAPISVPMRQCIKESILFPNKLATETNYIYIAAYPTALARQRINYLAQFNPTLMTNGATTAELTTAGEQFDGSSTPGELRCFHQTLLKSCATSGRENVMHFALLSNTSTITDAINDPSHKANVKFVADILVKGTGVVSDEIHHVESLPYSNKDYAAAGIAMVGTTYNGFNTSEEKSGMYVDDMYSFFAISGTDMDAATFSSSQTGFTVQFWFQGSSTTRGFVYAVVDSWVVTSTQHSYIFERLGHVLENTDFQEQWFAEDWNCYHAVYISGMSHSLYFVTAKAGATLEQTKWDLEDLQLHRLFDSKWHQITIVVDNVVPGNPTAKLFVDGESATSTKWSQCLGGQRAVEAIKPMYVGQPVRVINNRRELVRTKGMLIVGGLNARLFDLSVTRKTMTQDEVISTGAPGMELFNDVSRVQSVALGVVTLVFVFVSLGFAVVYFWQYFFGLNKEELESDEEDFSSIKTTKNTNPSEFNIQEQNMFENISVPFYQFVQPVLLVIQVMNCYLNAWEWPAGYTKTFGFGFGVVSFELERPFVSPLLWPVIKFAVAIFLLFWLTIMVWRDRDSFLEVILLYHDILRLRAKKVKALLGVGNKRSAQAQYTWVKYLDDGSTIDLMKEEVDTLVRTLNQMMASRMKSEANMRLHSDKLITIGSLGIGILLYERVNGNVFISFRSSDHDAKEDRDRAVIELTQVRLELKAENSLCPVHNLRLLPDDLMQYTCVHSTNPFYRSAECPKRCVMYACPNDDCDYAVCELCYSGSTVTAAFSTALASLQQAKKRGLMAFLGALLVELSQGIYLPTMVAAMSVIGCRVTFVCVFGDCWVDPSWRYVIALLFAFTALVFIGAGFFILSMTVSVDRHRLIARAVPHRSVPRTGWFWSLFPAKKIPPMKIVKEVDYEDFLHLDETVLATFYQPYKYTHYWYPVATYLFRFVLPAAVMTLEPGGLGQICAAVVLEALLALVNSVTSPYTSIWIEMLARLGSIHQMILLGLMSLHRVYVRDNPESEGYAGQMAAATYVYLGIVGLLMMLIVIVPALQRQIAARRRRSKETATNADGREENYDVGVWGQFESRVTLERRRNKGKIGEIA